MKPLLLIENESIIETIFRKVFLLVAGSEDGFSGCLGMRTIEPINVQIVPVGWSGVDECAEVKQYLETIHTLPSYHRPLLPTATPHSITGVEVGESIFASYSPMDGVWNRASSVLYGMYHELRSKEKDFDECSVDRLLLHTAQWNDYFPNDELCLLGKHVFKPELFFKEIEDIPGVHRY